MCVKDFFTLNVGFSEFFVEKVEIDLEKNRRAILDTFPQILAKKCDIVYNLFRSC